MKSPMRCGANSPLHAYREDASYGVTSLKLRTWEDVPGRPITKRTRC